MKKPTKKQYWIAQANHEIYLLGPTLSRWYFNEHVLPSMKISEIKEFYFKMVEINMDRDYRESTILKYGLPIDDIKIAKTYKKALKEKFKITESLVTRRVKWTIISKLIKTI